MGKKGVVGRRILVARLLRRNSGGERRLGDSGAIRARTRKTERGITAVDAMVNEPRIAKVRYPAACCGECSFHWRDLPYAIYPGPEKMCYSGGTLVEGDTVYAFYPGIGAGQMLAMSSDPLLLNWKKVTGKPINSPRGDACIWNDGNSYYALLGNSRLQESKNLVDWQSHGDILELPSNEKYSLSLIRKTPNPLLYSMMRDNVSCPYFWPIGAKHMFLFFSHENGGQYYLGDYDKSRKKFMPYILGRFNHGKAKPGGVHAPSAYPDPNNQGELVNIFNINSGIPAVN